MSFTKDAVTIRGGCNCRAVRYEVNVPPFSDRPPTPYRTPGADIGDLRIPCVLLCHCNDCRRATASILPMGLVAETKTVKASLLPRSAHDQGPFPIPDDEREYAPALDLFDFRNPALNDTYLSFYKHSPGRSRWFCSRCGTPVGYSADPGVIPPEWNWPSMLDIWLGSIDREDLAEEYMKPERMVWCHYGVPWIRKFAHDGAGGIPEHPLTKIDKQVGDDMQEDLAELEALESKAREAKDL